MASQINHTVVLGAKNVLEPGPAADLVSGGRVQKGHRIPSAVWARAVKHVVTCEPCGVGGLAPGC